MMTFASTRGGALPVTFREALLAGIAPDGGLYVPDFVPRLPQYWQTCASIADLGVSVLRPYVGDELTNEKLAKVLSKALSFPVPTVALGGGWKGVHVLELFHGPTQSFKDFGARTMAGFMENFLEGEACTILVATSGDTGSAVASGFSGVKGFRIAVLYPDGQVSPTQESQLTAQRPGVQAYRVDGSFDDCQRMVKAALTSGMPLRLSAANSINVGRLLPQMLYYVWAFACSGFETATVCVPCGNLGNLTAGVMTFLGGLPVRRFVAAHNANNGFPRYLAGGPEPGTRSVRTLSNAMDVGVPSNFERLKVMAPEMRDWTTGCSVSDAGTLASIRRVYEETGYVPDPHTAVALEAARENQERPVLVCATAHPAKFPEIIEQALGWRPTPPDMLKTAATGPRCVLPLAATDAALQEALITGRD